MRDLSQGLDQVRNKTYVELSNEIPWTLWAALLARLFCNTDSLLSALEPYGQVS